MPGVIIDGAEVLVPGLFVLNFQDNPKFRLAPEDTKPRPKTWIRAIVLHTSRGIPGGKIRIPQKILPGLGPNTGRDERMAGMWGADDRHAGAHLICDHDASWVCTADLKLEAPPHAGNVNNVTIGIEMYQGGAAELYEGQLESVVKMVDFLTRTFSIQRQVPDKYRRALKRGRTKGIDLVGVYGHRDCSNGRGSGDPGDAIMQMLKDAGYEYFNFSVNEDKVIWAARQEKQELLANGIPGPRTAQALRDAGCLHGLWVARPGD